ncbi:hypothetical protein [Streptomyces acidiscabies]|uniref:Uncharacterized protein n=1 Tax=Streptomyces acidiscabies TaxID=42234 RepID=A0ABU4LWQ5_9ACTN|nr:hypothetical protein [Streptomyces acidiscabies]MDX3019996.1 hypothetical protein [Streptomyces acidiscabies]
MNSAADKYQRHSTNDGMPVNLPDTRRVVDFVDRLLDTVWTDEEQLAFKAKYYHRDTRQGIVEFWQDRWMEYAPETARHGRCVTWKHQRDAWAPYRVDGVHLEDGVIKAVILKDRTGVRWQAWPQHLEAAPEPHKPLIPVRMTTGYRTDPTPNRVSVATAVQMLRTAERYSRKPHDPHWTVTRETYAHHVKVVIKSNRSSLVDSIRVPHGVVLLAADRRFQITHTGDGHTERRWHARFCDEFLGTYPTDVEAADRLHTFNVKRLG